MNHVRTRNNCSGTFETPTLTLTSKSRDQTRTVSEVVPSHVRHTAAFLLLHMLQVWSRLGSCSSTENFISLSDTTWYLHYGAGRLFNIWFDSAGYLHSHIHHHWLMPRKVEGCSDGVKTTWLLDYNKIIPFLFFRYNPNTAYVCHLDWWVKLKGFSWGLFKIMTVFLKELYDSVIIVWPNTYLSIAGSRLPAFLTFYPRSAMLCIRYQRKEDMN